MRTWRSDQKASNCKPQINLHKGSTMQDEYLSIISDEYLDSSLYLELWLQNEKKIIRAHNYLCLTQLQN